MADCPKCGYHLKLTDWRQYCPKCKTNIVIYDLQERLMQDADIAEVQHYHFQKKLDNLKASFIGSKLAIARIVTSLIPIAAVFLPLFKGELHAPFEEFSGNISAIQIYNGFDTITGSISELTAGKEGTLLIAAVASLLVSLVLTLVHLILLMFACSPKGKIRNIIQDVLILITTIAPAVLITMAQGSIISGTIGIGYWLYLALQLANAGVDIATLVKGIPVSHKQCYVGGIPIEEYFEMKDRDMPQEEIRAEQYRRLQLLQDEKEQKLKEDEEKKHHEHTEEKEESTDE